MTGKLALALSSLLLLLTLAACAQNRPGAAPTTETAAAEATIAPDSAPTVVANVPLVTGGDSAPATDVPAAYPDAGQAAEPGAPAVVESYPAPVTSDSAAAPGAASGGVSSSDAITLTPADIFDIFMARYPGAQVYELELDREHGLYLYEIDGFDATQEYELKIHPSSGAIIREEVKARVKERVPLARTTVERVAALVDQALQAAGAGATLADWTLETVLGRAVVEVEMDTSAGRDVAHTYDVMSGELLKVDD